MPLAIRKGSLCDFCSFRTSQSLRPSPSFNRPNWLLRYRSTSGTQGTAAKKRLATRPDRYGFGGGKHQGWEPDARHSSSRRRARDEGLVEPTESTYGVFGRLLLEQLHGLEFTLKYKERALVQAWGINTHEELDEKLAFFKGKLDTCIKHAEKGKLRQDNNPLFYRMRNAFITEAVSGLTEEMKFSFINEVATANFTPHHKVNQEKLADLRYPLEWYPATRAMQRTIHLHIGPTNSGKTYHALQRLEAAESGIYAGPLRLLAHEVYTRLNAKGKACALVTGEERRIPENYKHTMNSCTVEMVPLNAKVDVAVIDEIQMMGDTDRGWAWTQAFLGVQAKEVHLCGETRTRRIITDLCAAMGDKLVIHEYERLSPLKTQNNSLGRLENLEKGDAIILFSRVAIHAMRADIEKITRKRCAVVYGSLPPETRAQQAALFNDPDNDYDFLVASDAVGMGLNLSIKRVIFESTQKHDGVSFRTIKPYEIKQIAGRAGRYKTAQEAIGKANLDATEPLALDARRKPFVKPTTNVGYVTTLTRLDLPVVKQAMEIEVEPLASVGILPPADVLLRFSSYFPPGTPFGYIVLRLHDMAAIHPQFHLCRLNEQIQVADLIQGFNLSNMDRITLMGAPVSLRDAGMNMVVQELARCIAEQKGGSLLDMECFDLDLIDKDIHDFVDGSKGYLRKAEALHRAVTLYLWLSYRFAGIFTDQALAFHVKTLIEGKIDLCLGEVSWTEKERSRIAYLRAKAAKAAAKEDALAKAAALSLEAEESSMDELSGMSLGSSFGEREAIMEPDDDLGETVRGTDFEEEDALFGEREAIMEPDDDLGETVRGTDFEEEDASLGEEALELKSTEKEVAVEEGHNYEDLPADSNGNVPTTPEEYQAVEISDTYHAPDTPVSATTSGAIDIKLKDVAQRRTQIPLPPPGTIESETDEPKSETANARP